MPLATPISGHTKDANLAKRRRFQIFKVAVASFLVLLLMYGGLRGRQQARLQARLNDVTLIRDQLQRKLNEEQRPSDQLAAGLPGADPNASRPLLSDPQVRSLVTALKARLDQFDSLYDEGTLSQRESLELRLARATVANLEQRFTDALILMTLEDEKGKRPDADTEIARFVDVLQVRAEAFYGLQKWQDALQRYEQMLSLKPNRVAAMTRVAECRYGLGRTNEAFVLYRELVKAHNDRGDALRLQGKLDAASRQYAKAAEIQKRLVEVGTAKP